MSDNEAKVLDEPVNIEAKPANKRTLIRIDIDDTGQVFVDAPLDECRELCYEALLNATRLVFYHKVKPKAIDKRDVKHDILNFVRGKRG